MPQTLEAEAFLSRIAVLPSGPGAAGKLSDVLQPSLDDEAALRKLFAMDKANARLDNLYVGLVDVFDAPDVIRTTRARVVKDEIDLSAKYVMPLSEGRRRKEGAPAMVATLEDFKKNWAIFSEGSLSQLLDWNNVIAAGGAVQACLNPVPEYAKVSKRALRKHFHTNEYPTSDVDLFLYGMTLEQAEVKINAIYEAVRDSVPWDVTCVRTKHTVSIHSQYPYRAIQIVLRLYRSPAEILAGFDIDAPCCAYDGKRVWANPRAIVAMMRQCNTVDTTRRSPSYEVRLAKYSERAFEVYVPTLRREEIDPTIFERSILRIQGLARLLVLEKLKDTETRTRYLTERRNLRGRQSVEQDRRRKYRKRYKGDLKTNVEFSGLEMNDYDVVSLHIPYGPGWDARRIEKLIYQTDLGMNSPFNPKNKDRRLHRHPAFFGTMEECLNDCCEHCIEPKNEEEKTQQEDENKAYIRGRVEFIQQDPGRQSISGSFNPIDVGEWAEQAYVGPVEKFFNAIAKLDRPAVAHLLQQEETDVNRRDHVGRTALQLAIVCKASDIACDLVDAGARITARVADGRTSLHLAAQLDLPAVVRKLLERSVVNAEKAKEDAEEKQKKKGRSKDEMDVDDGSGGDDESGSDDENSKNDWSSEDGAKGQKIEEQPQVDNGQIPEDETEEPDVFDLNAADWDMAFTPLQYAIASGSVSIVDELIAAGADVKVVTTANRYDAPRLHQLTATILTEDQDVACQIAKKLFAAGAVSSEADDELVTVFHRVVAAGRPQLVATFLSSDPNAKVVINTPHVAPFGTITSPIISTITRGNWSTLAILLAFNAKLTLTEEDFYRAREMSNKNSRGHVSNTYEGRVLMPIETALAKCDDVVDLVVALGADVNAPTMEAVKRNYTNKYHHNILDWVRCAISALDARLQWADAPDNDDDDLHAFATNSGWKGSRAQFFRNRREGELQYHLSLLTQQEKQILLEAKGYFSAVETLLSSHGAKTWDDLHPDDKADSEAKDYLIRHRPTERKSMKLLGYLRVVGECYNTSPVLPHLVARYDELFEARGRSEETPLQIVVWFGDSFDTPLSIALERGHWDTARLVLAIAHAQHQPDESKAQKFQTRDIVLDNDDEDSEDDDEDMDSDDEAIDFIDVAKRPSTVQTPTTARCLLQDMSVHWFSADGEQEQVGSVLKRAIVNDDFEAFAQIVDMHNGFPVPVPLTSSVLGDIIVSDRPDMLDELLRRTGLGVNIEVSVSEDGQAETVQKKVSKVYLGLNVHGKKRKDLATKGDPNAPPATETPTIPILWMAARAGALNIIKYLAGDRPVSAYRYYASTHSDERAQHLRQVRDLAGVLPRWLGWTMNAMNESVLTAAVIGDRLKVIETLVSLQPEQMRSALPARIRYVDFNLILVAANWGCSPEVFDYLLEQGVPVDVVDHRGWNVLHLLCSQDTVAHFKLLDHVLHKLPHDVAECLLVQQSKGVKNTPLHLAVKLRRLDHVGLLLSVKASPLVLRDDGGSTVLHVAVKQSSPKITRILLEAGPPEALFTEDSVGCTPLETACQIVLQHKVANGFIGNVYSPATLSEDFGSTIDRKPNSKLLPYTQDDKVSHLRATVQQLLQEGRLRNGTKLATELISFADNMEARLVERKPEAQVGESAKADQEPAEASQLKTDSVSPTKTLECLIEAAARADSRQRRLVHLLDVHQSVKSSLGRSVRPSECQKQIEVAVDDGLAQAVEESTEDLFERNSALSIWSSSAGRLRSSTDLFRDLPAGFPALFNVAMTCPHPMSY
ncbi:hypothetical protein SCP_0502540 [Sparassis crispa]|uniref:Ankyrin repeat protein n=1 Tax=Sparassis crispa TaxID=139825 RepID=A0A401GLY3_9APHY|nr:hypothetical protein SCP_0502540 [Sparassis crispa]GBE83207.1 hypothetical protein SCP_0502540 [Sparassis crispa]